VAMLASNESPDPPLPQVVEAVQRVLSGVNRYPDPTNATLRGRLSRAYGVPANRIAIGNGSCDILLAAADALLEPGAEVVYSWPSFSIYPHLAAATGATAVTVPLDDEDRHDLPAMADAVTVATRLVLVCNPNNPTSTAVPLEKIVELVDAVPRHVCVIVDEAYCEFNVLGHPDASLDLLDAHPNLVLLRTFSKVHGLCGLRVGFALCGAEEFRLAVDQVRQPFFCNAAAQAAAVEALEHGDEVTRRVERAVAGRLQLEEGLRDLGLRVADSQANFVWTHLPEDADEAEVVRGLAERGVLVRAGAALGREGALRVTCGTLDENDRFLTALAEIVNG
jgi:histidinol-phosphate aminotransferase